MGNVMWWIGVLALALFFELVKRVGLRTALREIWDFAGEIGPRDADERRRRWNWRLYGQRSDPPPYCGHRPHFVTRDESELLDYPDTGDEDNYADADYAPTTWPIQKYSDRR